MKATDYRTAYKFEDTTSVLAALPSNKALLVTVHQWLQRGKQRRALAKLEPHLLEDIGITQEQAQEEADKPFWKP
ncbi:MAG: DUF1127 domain-containing protein [Motiliproteus sp.]|nr:DUF1127 domain-containing protein [Motiliproteus sp.]